ncbi:folate/biopterin family MFS transporter [Flavobacteriaceae bacterium]|nr:folate/biopterin family MFS transporter [Flavobacteriaceae bacterium]
MKGTKMTILLDRYRLPVKDERTAKDYLLYPFRMIRSYFIRIKQMCDWRFILFLMISQMLIKGILYRISETTMLPIFKNMGVGAARLQIYMTVAMSPWSLKPVVGVLSDILTFYGYHKRYWLIQSICIGIIGALLTFPLQIIPTLLVLCFLALNYEMSIVDLLTESKYAEKMQEFPESGSDLITFVNGLQTIGSIVAMSFIGVLSDLKLFWVLFLIASIMAAIPLLPSFFGWLPETRVIESQHKCVYVDKPLFVKYKSIFLVVGFTGISGPVVAFLATFGNKYVGMVGASILLVSSVIGSYLAFPRIIANIGLYHVLARLTKPSMSTALDYFFTANAICLPDGPHFSFKYYITYTGITSQCMAFAAVWIYQSWLSKWRFRTVLITTTCLVGLGGVSDLLIVLRLNKHIGVSDHAFYMFGEAIFESVVEMLYWIPSSIIISKVCPKGLESATYAFLAGISNFGLMISSLMGSIIFEAVGVKKCNFDALWWLILCFHIILPIIGGIPATLLIPNVKQDTILLHEEDSDHILVRETTNEQEFSRFTSDDIELDFEYEFEEKTLFD